MAQKALAIDESLAQPHITLGFIYIMYKKDFDKGIAEAERAVALEPNSADIVAQLAIFLTGQDVLRKPSLFLRRPCVSVPSLNLVGCLIWPVPIA